MHGCSIKEMNIVGLDIAQLISERLIRAAVLAWLTISFLCANENSDISPNVILETSEQLHNLAWVLIHVHLQSGKFYNNPNIYIIIGNHFG